MGVINSFPGLSWRAEGVSLIESRHGGRHDEVLDTFRFGGLLPGLIALGLRAAARAGFIGYGQSAGERLH